MIRSISDTILNDERKARAYLRGAFLAGGSLNNPATSSYHLEIFSLYEEHNAALRGLSNVFDLNAKAIERKKGHILYIKESEKISDFLKLVDATQSMLRFEDVRILKICVTRSTVSSTVRQRTSTRRSVRHYAKSKTSSSSSGRSGSMSYRIS